MDPYNDCFKAIVEGGVLRLGLFRKLLLLCFSAAKRFSISNLQLITLKSYKNADEKVNGRRLGLCLGEIVCFGPYNRLLSNENMEIGDSTIWNGNRLFTDKTTDVKLKV